MYYGLWGWVVAFISEGQGHEAVCLCGWASMTALNQTLVEIIISSLQGRATFTRFVSSIASRARLIAWHRLHATFQDTAAHFCGLLQNNFRSKKY